MMKKGSIAVIAGVTPLHSANINWDKCCLCQVSRGTLFFPADNPIQSQKDNGYESLAINLEKLRKYEHDLPCGLRVDKLDEGDGILSTFILRKAK